MPKKILLSVAILLLLIIAAIYYVLFAPEGVDGALTEEELRRATSDPTLQLQNQEAFNQEDWRDVIAHYKKWASYPPDSRPLDEGQEDILEYRKITLIESPMLAIKDGKVVSTDAACLLQPDRHTVTEGESILFFLHCSKEENNTEIAPVSHAINRIGDTGPLPAGGKLSFNDKGTGGDEKAADGITTFIFQPDPADWGDMELVIKFTLPGVEPERFEHEVKASFFSSPRAPARFTGKVEEHLEEGSLVLYAELNVIRPGYFRIQGNLLTEDEEPVAYARQEKKLAGGRQLVPLLFYGKILRDEGRSGPFRLVGLRGERDNSGIDIEMLEQGTVEEVDRYLSQVKTSGPIKEQIPYLAGAYKTQEYKSQDFTDKEYDSPAKRQRIEMLESYTNP